MYRNDFTRQANSVGGLHGDVGIYRVDSLPDNAKRIDGRIIAEGEATGHHHVLMGDGVDIYEADVDGTKNLFAVVTGKDIVIQHQEHGTIEIQEGVYWIVRQVEYDGEEEMRVLD